MDSWSGPVQAIATAIGLPFLMLYVWKTWKIAAESSRSASATEKAAAATRDAAEVSRDTLKEMRAGREAELSPYVVAYIEMADTHIAYIVVRNLGRVPAKNVSFEFEPPLTGRFSATDTVELPRFLTGGIPFLPPGQELRSAIGTSIAMFSTDYSAPKVYTVHVSYIDSATGSKHASDYVLDVNIFFNRSFISKTSLKEIHESLSKICVQQEAIARSIERISESIERGILIANGSLVIEQAGDAARGEHAILAKLSQVADSCSLWSSLDEYERLSGSEFLVRHLQAIQRQLERLTADTENPELITRIRGIGKSIATVATLRTAPWFHDLHQLDQLVGQLIDDCRRSGGDSVSTKEEAESGEY